LLLFGFWPRLLTDKIKAGVGPIVAGFGAPTVVQANSRFALAPLLSPAEREDQAVRGVARSAMVFTPGEAGGGFRSIRRTTTTRTMSTLTAKKLGLARVLATDAGACRR
jgi:hypothetical protein